MKNILLDKIANKQIVVGVLGLGYVGLPLAVEYAKAGFRTIGFDVQDNKVQLISKGTNYIGDIVSSDLSEMVSIGRFSATTDFALIKDVDFVAICVPTPLDAHQQPDVSYAESSSRDIARNMSRNTIVVLESTTYPGTTQDLIMPILEEGSGLKCGVDFYLGFSPERVDPGNAVYRTSNTPKVVGAIGEDAREVISEMYRAVITDAIHTVSSPAVAEMSKILENTYRNVNIGLINELAILCNKMKIDIWEVIEAAKTKPFGFQAFYPGPGLGGHCIPLDPYYLSWKAREYRFHTSMIEASMMVNDRMPEYCVDRAAAILNKCKKSLNGSKVLVLGVAYKQDVEDYRESPALDIVDILQDRGAEVKFYDPFISEYKYKGVSKKGELVLTEKLLRESDMVVITTNHSNVDYSFVQRNAVDILDTRNAMAGVSDRVNIELL